MVFRVSCKLGFCISNLASVSAYRLVLGIFNPLAKCKSSCSRYSAVASKYNEGAKMQHVAERSYQVVVAATRDMGIGKDGKLPWKLPSDLKFFKDLTSTTSDPGKKNAVVMGRKTWESIPLQYRPLPGRLNVVLTRSSNVSIDLSENVLLCGSMKSAFELLATSPYSLTIENVFVIGGGQILRETLNAQGCVAIHITEIESDIDCDTFIPAIDFSLFWPWCASCPLVENDIRHAFVTYVRVKNSQLESLASDNMFGSHDASDFRKHDIENFDFLPKMILERHEEYAYQELIQDIVSKGFHSIDGRGTSIFSKFGCQMRFNLRKSFPLFTTKELSWRGVVGELLQFIGGSTDMKVLSERVTHTWDGRIHPESLMCRKEDDLESIDRFQHRQSCARYKGVHTECTGQEFGQLVTVIEKINNRLVDSHVFLSVCNPSVQNTAEFPPGYTFAQFYVVNGELSCQVYQASTEVGHGVPYNVSSYALLTCLIAHVCNHSPGDVTLQFEEAYVDEAHIKSLLELLQRHPKPFPILKINSGKKDIDSFMTSDFELTK